jgi:uncharacterized protein (TIGR02246 family)
VRLQSAQYCAADFQRSAVLDLAYNRIMQSEEEKIRQVVMSFYDAFNSHKFESAQEFTTSDWIHVNPVGGWSEGREAVLNELKEVHSTFLRDVTDNVESISVRFASPEVAVVMVPSTLTGSFTTPDGERHENDRQIRSFVVVKVENRWRIMHDHNTFRLM